VTGAEALQLARELGWDVGLEGAGLALRTPPDAVTGPPQSLFNAILENKDEIARLLQERKEVQPRVTIDRNPPTTQNEPKPPPPPPKPSKKAASPPPRPAPKRDGHPWPDKSVTQRHEMIFNPGAKLVPPPKAANVSMPFVPPIDFTLPGVAAAVKRDLERAAQTESSEEKPAD
jgi:hypothetical protein